MKFLVPFFALLLLIFGCVQSKAKPITEFSQNDINKGILVDVRTLEEYQAGHIDKAVNINWFDADFAKQFENFEKDKTIYVYCKKGGRSAKAVHLLDSLGFKNVVDLEGGYDSWIKKSD
ncbi:MAG: rhodanese-like domain-containing protein [Aurantibacter sp.]